MNYSRPPRNVMNYSRPPRFNRYEKGKNVQENSFRNHEDSCYRYGKMGHWSKACRMPGHLCLKYKTSEKGKEKEVNFNEHKLTDESAYLEVPDFKEGTYAMEDIK
ncbi:hypothetical protein LIER_42322 [Lithospermum erythrorhizon]|uniref:CCHC-type domain-containing protein n=1 Tax=Lithospermum erythrorhizon TaxID=34254 RepID=A0AAV3RRS7_LITER